MTTSKVLLGVLAGVATGAVLGLLFAPEKGSVTRKKIATKGNDLVGGLKEKFNTFLEEIQKDVETVKEKASEYLENGVAKV